MLFHHAFKTDVMMINNWRFQSLIWLVEE